MWWRCPEDVDEAFVAELFESKPVLREVAGPSMRPAGLWCCLCLGFRAVTVNRHVLMVDGCFGGAFELALWNNSEKRHAHGTTKRYSHDR